jgi:phospholipid-binding lipoprotein MlaA
MKIFASFAVISCIISSTIYANSDHDLPDDIDAIEEIKIDDKLECMNRDIYALNKSVDKVLVSPVTKVYKTVTVSDWGRKRINNALQNLDEPNRMINSIFYGKPAGFFTSALRFMLNSTFGILGLFDPATKLGIHKYDLSFRKVISEKLCIKRGNYFVIPVLGPSTVRNAVALGIDKFVLDPFTFIFPLYATMTRFGMELMATRHDKADVIDQISESSLDEYAMVRGLYYQSDKVAEFDYCCEVKK